MIPDVKRFEARAERAATRDLHGHTTQADAAFTAILEAARELKVKGTATYLDDLVSSSTLWRAFDAHGR
jgi:hypothetical protein